MHISAINRMIGTFPDDGLCIESYGYACNGHHFKVIGTIADGDGLGHGRVRFFSPCHQGLSFGFSIHDLPLKVSCEFTLYDLQSVSLPKIKLKGFCKGI